MIVLYISMQSKSINRLSSAHPLLLALLLTIVLQGECQPDCAGKSFPDVIPLRLNESMVINLEDYFDGTNLTFTVSPNNKFSSLDETFRCQTVDEQRVGRIVSSRYTYQNSQQLLTTLTESDQSPATYTIRIINVRSHATVAFPLSTVDIANCTHFALLLINSTHFKLAVNCKYTRKFWTDALVTAIVNINDSVAQWTLIEAPLFSYTQDMSSRIEFGEDTLIRGVFSPSNSYVELWSWNDEAHELVSLIDKTFFGYDSFYLKDMQLHGNLLVILDYRSGLHLIRVTPTRRFLPISSIAQPFHENFQYNPVTGVLYLGKRGKIVSINLRLQGLQFGGSSYNIYKYEHIRQIIPTDRNLIVLGQSTINLFRLTTANSDTRHYQIFQAEEIKDAFPMEIPNQPLTVLLVRNLQPLLSLAICQVKSAYLTLAAPEGAHTVTVTAKSIMDGRSSTCQQEFTIIRQTTDRDFIYDNGYNTDNEILYANLPGEGVVELSKYALGRNLQYRVTPSQNSKIDYQINIRKTTAVACTVQEKIISNGADIYLAKSWGKLLLTQFSSDNTLRYYLCLSTPAATCYFGFDSPNLALIDHLSHQTIDQSNNQTVILQALLQQSRADAYILVRKITINQRDKIVAAEQQCSIVFANYTQNAANITQVEIINSRLFVLLPFRKQIRIYNLLDRDCPLLTTLNAQNSPWGYFAPRSLHFDRVQGTLRQQVIVIQQWNEMFFVKLQVRDNQLRPVLLSTNILQEPLNTTILISHPYLLLFSKTTNQAFTYFIDDSRHLNFLRQLPLLGRRFVPSSPTRNDYAKLLDSTHVAVTLLDPKQNIVYNAVYKFDQLISATQQYNQIKLQKNEQLVFLEGQDQSALSALRLSLISSASTSYLLCKSNYTYLSPSVLLKFKQARIFLQEYTENANLLITSANDNRTHRFKISISNVGNTIKRGSKFPARGTAVQAENDITIPDIRWFSGSIFDYQFDCADCHSRIKFKKKVTLEEREQLMVPRDNFLIEEDARIVKVIMGQWLVEMEQNYTAYPFDQQQMQGYGLRQATLLAGISDNCVDAKQMSNDRLIISLCWRPNIQDQRQYYLSLASSVSAKGFVLEEQPIAMDGSNVQLLLKNELIVVYSSSIALILTLWQVQGKLQFLQLDQIDQEDISSPICSAQITTNATSASTPITNILYSLIITQCSSTLFYTTFSLYLEKQEYVDESGKIISFSIPNIHINNAQNIDLIRLLSQRHIQLPSEAIIIQTISRNEGSPSRGENLYSLVAVFDKFHTFQFLMRVNSISGIILSLTLDGIFYKFGAYEAVSANNADYMVIKYVLDNGFGKLDEMYGFYDVDSYTYSSEQIKEHHMFEAYSLTAFKGLQENSEVPWHLNGHTITQFNNQYLQRVNISNLLRAHISGLSRDNSSQPYQQLYTQNIIITANNPNSARSASISLKAIDLVELTTLQIAMIVIGSIVVFALLIVLARFAYKKYDTAKKMVPLLESTLAEQADLEQEQEERVSEWRINDSVRGSVEP